MSCFSQEGMELESKLNFSVISGLSRIRTMRRRSRGHRSACKPVRVTHADEYPGPSAGVGSQEPYVHVLGIARPNPQEKPAVARRSYGPSLSWPDTPRRCTAHRGLIDLRHGQLCMSQVLSGKCGYRGVNGVPCSWALCGLRSSATRASAASEMLSARWCRQ